MRSCGEAAAALDKPSREDMGWTKGASVVAGVELRKYIDISGDTVVSGWRFTIIGVAGLWNLRRGRHSRQNFLQRLLAYWCSREVLTGNVLGSHVALVHLVGEVHVYSSDLLGEGSSTRAASQINQLRSKR